MITRLGVLACLFASGACASSGAARTTRTGTVSKWIGSFRPAGLASNATFSPTTANRGTGTITVTPMAGTPATTHFELSINTGGGSGNQVAWAVFSGGCGAPGPYVAGQNQFPPISVSTSGDGRVQVDLPVTLDPHASYHANVYWTPRVNDMNDVMMCANLQAQ